MNEVRLEDDREVIVRLAWRHYENEEMILRRRYRPDTGSTYKLHLTYVPFSIKYISPYLTIHIATAPQPLQIKQTAKVVCQVVVFQSAL